MKLFFIAATLALLRCSHAGEDPGVTSREPITCDGFACEVCRNGGYCIPAPLNGYVCKCPGSFTGPRCDVCLIKPDWLDGGNGYQYWKTPTKMTYENAQKECDKHGAQLAIHGLRNPYFQRKLATHFEPEVLWIGLTDRAIEGTFIWNDGIESSSAWFNWGGPVPQSGDTADCVAIANSTDAGLSFDAFNCSMEFEGYCEAPIGSPVLAPLYDTSMGLKYTIIPPAVYETSELLCERLGGNLAVNAVNHGEMLRKVLNHFQETGYIGSSNVFLGFEDVIMEGQFTSRSGIFLSTPLFWNVANPGPNTAYDNCLTATPEYSAWLDDKNCSLLLPGLCEIGSQNFLSERECKSGKMCPPFSVCAVNDATCFEECICMEGYAGFNQSILGFSCKYDMCHNNKITCGGNSFCTVVDESTFEQDCVCEDGFFAIGNIHADGCVELCEGVNCGVDAYCVYNTLEEIEECRCKPGYAPNNSAAEGCFYDLCAGGNITCGENAKCCILDESAKLQGCRCDDGFVPKPDPMIGCVAPCANIVCGANARCVAETNSTVGHCECNEGNLPNTTAEEGCFYDQCGNEDIVCGSFAICAVLNTVTQQQGCVCYDGYFPNTTAEEGCVDPCDGVTCGSNARCVVDPDEVIGHCECDSGFLPNNTAADGCFYDECADQTITCGVNALCVVLYNVTKIQGCICRTGFLPNPNPEQGCVDPCANVTCGPNSNCAVIEGSATGHCQCINGFLPSSNVSEGCFHDECASEDIVCGPNALCGLLCEKTKLQGCTCYDGYLANKTAASGCYYDQCGNGDIVCGSFARCAVLDTDTQQQGCVCYDGYFPNTTAEEGCVDPCDGVTCGSNARCVVDPDEVIGHCECNSGFLPNDTAVEGCFYDLCGNGNITCGEGAQCGVLCSDTKLQGCSCLPGFLPNNTAEEGCFYDECASGNITCGLGARCCVLCDKTKFQGCTCLTGFLANDTADEGCVPDRCFNDNITCGSNARCSVLDVTTKEQGCTCLAGFLPNPDPETGCIDPCAGVWCGENARCVIDHISVTGRCECDAGFLPNNTAKDGCFYDLCGNGNITCGDFARCGVLCDNTNLQGCSCLPGYLPNNTAQEGCFFDLCANGNITCGNGARCSVLCDETKLQGCSCLSGFFPYDTAEEGCLYDQCTNLNITCPANGRCALLNEVSKEQGCVCLNGYTPTPTADVACTVSDCTTLSALDIHFAEVTVSGVYETQISDPIFTGISRSTAGFSQFAAFGSTAFSTLSGTQDNAQLVGIAAGTTMNSLLATLNTALTRTGRNDVLIISGVTDWNPANIGADLSDVLVIAIDGAITDTAFVQIAIDQAVSGICAWVQGGFTASTNVYVSM